MSSDAAGWIKEDGWGYSSTCGGSEPGCVIALKVLEILERPGVLENVRTISKLMTRELNAIKERHPFLVEIRQNGLIIGLRFDNPDGGVLLTSYSYASGLWAFPAGFRPVCTSIQSEYTGEQGRMRGSSTVT